MDWAEQLNHEVTFSGTTPFRCTRNDVFHAPGADVLNVMDNRTWSARSSGADPLCSLIGADAVAKFEHVDAVSLDLFNTLIYHREGHGRGRALVAYLTQHGFEPRPWEHGILYEILALHAEHYSPHAPPDAREAYLRLLAQRTFERLHISASSEQVEGHRHALWRILGADCFELFPEVVEALEDLKRLGYPLVLISNWQRGVAHYCTELGLASFFDHILGSADFEVAKPDPRIFKEASSLLGVEPGRIVHVGDSWSDDYLGGQAAGFQVCLIDRDSANPQRASNVIRSLAELPMLLAVRS